MTRFLRIISVTAGLNSGLDEDKELLLLDWFDTIVIDDVDDAEDARDEETEEFAVKSLIAVCFDDSKVDTSGEKTEHNLMFGVTMARFYTVP